jgi:flagellum-specific peptidoglycan hydrolase FlgJ
VAKAAKKTTKPKSTLSPEKAAFIKDAAVAAQASEAQTGVPASVTIAQAILESGWGEHHMGDANNYFGIKAQVKDGKIVFGDVAIGFVDRNTKEFDHQGHPFFVTAHFRAYKDMAGSFIDHGMFLKNGPRYAGAMALYAATKDANQFAQGLQDAGYATDPHYANLLVSLMTKHDLYKFNAK